VGDAPEQIEKNSIVKTESKSRRKELLREPEVAGASPVTPNRLECGAVKLARRKVFFRLLLCFFLKLKTSVNMWLSLHEINNTFFIC
jgi:hypothetical protein